MEVADAANLIRAAITRPGGGGVWADLGAGTGTFTRALASLLGEGGVVHAVDRRDLGVAAGASDPSFAGAAKVERLVADFREPLPFADLDGILMANALHFVPAGEQPSVLASVASYLRPGGALLLVEYDERRGSRWVPYPVPFRRLESLAREVGLGVVREVGRRRSRFGPTDMYAAVGVKGG